MKNILLATFVLITTFLNAQWDKTIFDKMNPDKTLGVASYTKNGEGIWTTTYFRGDTNVYFSSDGGYTFKSVPISKQSDSIRIFNLEPLDEKIVYANCMQTYNVFHSTFFYKQSNDGGETWKPFYIIKNDDTAFKNKEIESLFFYDSIHGTAIGNLSNDIKEIWNTSDGGKTWQYLPCDSIELPNCARNFPLTKSTIIDSTVIFQLYNYNSSFAPNKINTFGLKIV